jgi:hypothetical protein
LPRLASNFRSPASTSQVAGIIGESHQCLAGPGLYSEVTKTLPNLTAMMVIRPQMLTVTVLYTLQ